MFLSSLFGRRRRSEPERVEPKNRKERLFDDFVIKNKAEHPTWSPKKLKKKAGEDVVKYILESGAQQSLKYWQGVESPEGVDEIMRQWRVGQTVTYHAQPVVNPNDSLAAAVEKIKGINTVASLSNRLLYPVRLVDPKRLQQEIMIKLNMNKY